MPGCCCGEDPPPGCGGLCSYLAVGGVWVLQNPGSCSSPCSCFTPTIVPEFEGQMAGCSCYDVLDPPPDPRCTYEI